MPYRRVLPLMALLIVALGVACAANNNTNNAASKPAAAVTTVSTIASAAQTAVASQAATKPPTQPPAQAATKAPTQSGPVLGQTVKVGDLDLTVSQIRMVDTTQYNQFNSANVAVDLQLVNARGASYSFNAFLALKLVDANGVAHTPELGCDKCPNSLTSVTLVKAGHAEGSAYFKIPTGTALREIDYQAIGSTNKVAIPVSFTAQ